MIEVSDSDSSSIEIGKIVKAQGLDGKLKVNVYSGDPGALVSFKHIYVGTRNALKPFVLINSRSKGKFAILTIAEIVDRNGAEALVGQEVWVLKDQMPTLSSDEYYWHDMVGLTVMTEKGVELGQVTALIATGAHDVMVVSGRDKDEYLIPVVRDIVVRQDLEARVLVIAPPPGLLEMNLPDAI